MREQHKAWQEATRTWRACTRAQTRGRISRAAAERLTRQVNGLTQQVDGRASSWRA
ncbi:MbeD/MobD family mobilization/exclusion protein [Klebsiella pneumoniae]|uniref:MbeD/MobD family mobilization/exclusion protein n=1 Tax=Klebsiella pneumoniae TaxID=573 RepID=UPI003A5CAED2